MVARYLKLLILLFALFFAVPYFADSEVVSGGIIMYSEIAEYWTYSGKTVTVSWDSGGSADFFQVKAVRVEDGTEYMMNSNTTQLQETFTIPRAGHYDFYVRAGAYNVASAQCLSSGCTEEIDPVTGQTVCFSRWAVSTEPGDALRLTADGTYVFGAWRVFASLAPPGIPVIQ